MSEQHEHQDSDSPAGAQAKPHDPRLDSSGEEHPAVQPLPFDLIALESTRLGPGFHRDPADQIIAATARVHGLRLLTSDQRIIQSKLVPVIE